MSEAPKPFFTRRRIAGLAITLACAALFIAFLPWVVANTPLRNAALNRAIPNPDLNASASSAQFGWISPLKLDELRIVDQQGRLTIDVDQLTAERSAMSLWWHAPELGHLRLQRPNIDIVVPLSIAEMSSTGLGPTFRTTVTGANVTVRSQSLEQPVVDLRDVDLAVSVQRQNGGRQLVVAPVKIFDRHQLTPELCDQGLQLIAPILAKTATVKGQVSLELGELQFPLDLGASEATGKSTVTGRVQLHEVTSSLKSPLLQQIVAIAEKSFGVDIPERIQIADESQVEFRLQDGRVYHDSLAFFFPDLSGDLLIKTSGSVGLDQTLDLTIAIPLPLPIAKKAIKIQVTGTLSEPKFGLPDKESFLADLAALGTGDGDQSSVDHLIDMGIGLGLDLLKKRAEGREERPMSLIERFRARQRGREDESKPPPKPARGKLLRDLIRSGLEAREE